MTLQTAMGLASSSVFAGDEPALQSHPLLKGVEVPRFGETGRWPCDAVRRPANVAPWQWVINFSGLTPVWNLRAREIAMAVFNPQHPALEDRGVDLGIEPMEPGTVIGRLSELRMLARWASEQGLPDDLRGWTSHDMKTYIAAAADRVSRATVANYVVTIRLLNKLDPVLTGGGLPEDPWPGRSARAVAGDSATGTVKTPNIPPEIWFPLMRAAWTYIDTFAGDILRARETFQRLRTERDEAVPSLARSEQRLTDWLAAPEHLVPVHHDSWDPARPQDTKVNRHVLALLAGAHPHREVLYACSGRGQRIHAHVQAAIDAGRVRPASLIDGITQTTRTDGTAGPWHLGIDSVSLGAECRALRAATFIFVAGISMMRDSELREITRGSVVDHYGAPAITSRKRKHDPGRPREHWWIIEPAAQAIAVAEALSLHPELVFADPGLPFTSDKKTYENTKSRTLVTRFIEHVNAHRNQTGLDEIPAGRVAPHMFRKTMAMLAATMPGSEIALGLQLKHAATRALANRSTQGYSATDPAWERHLDTAIEEARFTRLRDLYDRHQAGETIGYGPGAALGRPSRRTRSSASPLARNRRRIRHPGTAHRPVTSGACVRGCFGGSRRVHERRPGARCR